jgi:hypothetical protein
MVSKDRAIPGSRKYPYLSIGYSLARQTIEQRGAAFFLPGGKICPFASRKTGLPDCLTGIRPILKNCFSAVPVGPIRLPWPLQGLLTTRLF